MKWKPYPKYKDSGVEWLGEVPEHWTVAALAYRYVVALGKMLDGRQIVGDQLAPYLRNVDVQWDRVNTVDLPEMDFGPTDRCRFSLRPGDLMVREGGEVGRAAIWVGQLNECYYQKALHRLRAHRVERDDGRFMLYVLWDSACKGRFTGCEGRSTIAHLTAEALRRYLFVFPPKEEQAQVALHLDRETAKIDTLIAKQERLIELLQEKRQALISHGVTKGLNPDALMKPTGVEWLGEVPAHWKKHRLGYLVDMASGSTPDKALPEYWSGAIPWISPKDLKSECISASEDHISESAVRDWGMKLIPARAVLVVVRGMILAHTFPVGLTTIPTTINQDMKALLPKCGCTPEFLAALLRGRESLMLSYVDDAAHGTKCLRTDRWKGMKIFLPSVAEQGAICDWIAETGSQMDAVIAKVHQSIALMREHRTALISAAVTGKVDVREFNHA